MRLFTKTLIVFIFICCSNYLFAQQIAGNIFIDRDGLTDNDINKSAGVNNAKTNIAGALFANLLNNANQAVASVAVNTDGTYLFNNIVAGNYILQLTTNPSTGTYANPIAAPLTTLPLNWINTGEFIGNTEGNDGVVNGKSALINIVNGSTISEVNFGIEHLPETNNVIAYIPHPVENQFITLNFLNNGAPPYFSGSDPEDLPNSASLVGRKVKIESLVSYNDPTFPPLSFEVVEVFYNSTAVTVGQIIEAYNPALLQVRFRHSNPNNTGYEFSGREVKFNYSFVDAAGNADPTPARYLMRYPVAGNGGGGGPLPLSLLNFNATKNKCNADISWITGFEVETEKFEIEFNKNNYATFEKAGTIIAAGNSTSNKKYEFTYAMESGVVYYFRLKLINKDGTTRYSDVRPVSCDSKMQIDIAPNPTVNVFHITGMMKGKNTVSVYSKNGKLVKTVNAINNKDIDVSNLAIGVYFISVINENGIVKNGQFVKY
jgi:Secretion system C-terminal sorting domain